MNVSALDVCKYSIVVFTGEHSNSIIKKLLSSTIDMKASILSELSLLNNSIRDYINFNYRLIDSEYIDYLINEINQIINTASDNSQIESIVNFSNISLDIAETSKDEDLAREIQYVQNKISSMIKNDISKSTVLRPKVTSKVTDLILSVKEIFSEINDICNDRISKLNDCDALIETCNFCLYYSSKYSIGDTIPIFENPYKQIISHFMEEYNLWKGVA